jgi:hypothetical protein
MSTIPEGLSFRCPPVSTDGQAPSDAPHGALSQQAADRQRRAAGATARLRKEARCTARPRAAPSDVGRPRHRKRCHGSQVTATPKAVASRRIRSAVVRRVAVCCFAAREPPRSKRRCQRRCDQGRLGPGSGRSLRKCALPTRRGPRPRQSRPLSRGRTRFTRLRKRSGLQLTVHLPARRRTPTTQGSRARLHRSTR